MIRMDHDSKPWWDYCKQRVLTASHCTECGHWFHFPRSLCPACLSEDVRLERVRGFGRLYSYTMRPAQEPYAARRIGWVQLDEQEDLLVIGEFLDDEPVIGDQVSLDWVPYEDRWAPAFRRAG
jgi:uncharacterized OB-fold protein